MTGAPAVSSPFHELPLSMAAGSLLGTTTVPDIGGTPQMRCAARSLVRQQKKVKIIHPLQRAATGRPHRGNSQRKFFVSTITKEEDI